VNKDEYSRLCHQNSDSRLLSGGSYGNSDCFTRADRAPYLSGYWPAGSVATIIQATISGVLSRKTLPEAVA